MEEFFNEFGFIGKPQARRLQNSPNFCVFKYAQAVKQKVWNEAKNRERDWGETLKIGFFSLASHALRACEAPRFPDFFTDFETTVLQSTGPRRVLTGFPVHSLPVVPACSLSSLLLLLVRKGRTPPLARRLCFTLGLPTTGLIAPGTCLDGNPIPGLSGALIELARLMLSGLSLVSNPLNVSALLGPFDPGPVTASDGVLPRVSLWGSSNEAPSNDTCWIAVTRDSLRTKDNYTQLKNEDSTVGTLYCNEIFLTANKFLKVTQTFQWWRDPDGFRKLCVIFKNLSVLKNIPLQLHSSFVFICLRSHPCLSSTQG